MRVRIFDRMEECTEEAVQAMLPQVSQQRREQALRFRHVFGQFCCLKSWLMLSAMHIGEMEFLYNEHGKPDLKEYPNLYFNLSHCKNAIAVAMDSQPVGIDVERFVSPSDSLLRYTLNDEELEEVRQSASPEQTFSMLWTRKEAISKLHGTGLNNNLKQMLTNLPADIRLDSSVNTEKCYVCTIAYYAEPISSQRREAGR